ncbi:MAG TPA: hypothetical protein VG388_04545 [Solirubrobacteraceae bacterium]|jgi:hypothetical protein|nr:hypothetical protein [Solirubrobacteraceae bacterium]
MRTRRNASIQELRHAIDALPLKTRVAMLEGIRNNEIILGAYTTSDGGICPMLAAHRGGGRTNAEGFAKTWDRFGGVTGRRARRATERELLILTTHLEMSLLADTEPATDLAVAVAEHRRLVARDERAASRRHDNDRAARRERVRAERAIAALRPGDRDRSSELKSSPGWAWMRVFRRYDDYERALARLEAQSAELVVRRRRAPATRA